MVVVDSPAPDFALPDQDGNQIKLSDLKGQAVVLYFYPRERPVVTAPGGCGSCGSSVETDQRMPPIAAQIANYGKAWAKHVANGLKILEPEGVAERLAACNSCPFLSADRRCYECGCPVDNKATWESEDCGKGRWPRRSDVSPVLATANLAYQFLQDRTDGSRGLAC